jgi:hypothetical protein
MNLEIACALILNAVLLEQAIAIDSLAVTRSNSMLLVAAKTYRHCHNTPRRVYCHTNEPLPVKARETAPTYRQPPKAPQRHPNALLK